MNNNYYGWIRLLHMYTFELEYKSVQQVDQSDVDPRFGKGVKCRLRLFLVHH